MSEESGGPPRLRAVPPAGATGEAAAPEPADGGTGLTPPRDSHTRARFVSDVIVELGYLPRERVDAAVEEGRSSGRTPERVLLEAGALTSDQYARAVAERFGLDHVDLTVYKADVSALNLIGAQAARRFSAVPIGFDEAGALMVAMVDPSNVLALDDLKLMTGHEVRPVVASNEDVATLIGRMSRLTDAVAEAIEEDDDEALAAVSDIRESADDAPVIKLVNSIIAQAVQEGASDVHFEPDGGEMRIRQRVDGVLQETTVIPRRMTAGVISRIKIMGDLDIAERRLPQDGRVSLAVEGRTVDIRIVTMPSVHGEGAVMRLLDKSSALISLDALGMGEDSRERVEGGIWQPHGAVLATGPTGSGKSTTLYAALNALNSVDRNIITIEDPVEYQLSGVNQIQVNTKANLTFARGLRSILRADPDVIMVGEIRDAETARIAVESALTGHLLLSTLHTNDAPSAMTRLTEMGIEPFLTASAVTCVVAQRLVRVLCTSCKQRTVVSAESLRASGFPADFDVEAYEPAGCTRCSGSGYKGRLGIYEVMTVSDEIRELTIGRSSADEIGRVAIEQGMRPLRADGLEKVKQGVSSVAEVTRVT
jgi:type IV pilus assembly protein PilB